MALITEPAALLASANCFSCFGSSPGMMQLLKLAMLREIAIAQGVPVANLDPAALLASASCLSCFTSSPGTAQLMELALLLQIAQNGTGGGGGGGSQQVLVDATGAPPPDPTKPAISFPTGGGGMSEWDVPSQTWI